MEQDPVLEFYDIVNYFTYCVRSVIVLKQFEANIAHIVFSVFDEGTDTGSKQYRTVVKVKLHIIMKLK